MIQIWGCHIASSLPPERIPLGPLWGEVGTPHAMLDHMVDLHALGKTALRVPAEVKAAAQAALAAQPDRPDPWTLNDVLVASLAMLAKRPAAFLKQLEPFKPPRKRGRPPKTG